MTFPCIHIMNQFLNYRNHFLFNCFIKVILNVKEHIALNDAYQYHYI